MMSAMKSTARIVRPMVPAALSYRRCGAAIARLCLTERAVAMTLGLGLGVGPRWAEGEIGCKRHSQFARAGHDVLSQLDCRLVFGRRDFEQHLVVHLEDHPAVEALAFERL